MRYTEISEGPKPIPATADDVMNAIKNAVTRASRHPSWLSWDKPFQDSFGNLNMGVRDWGHWRNPDDAEDEEDYDWQVLSDDDSERMNGIIQLIAKQYPGFDIRWSTEEKNWINFTCKPKK